MANKRTTVRFGGIPSAVLQSRMPDAQGRDVDYTVMRLGSDDVLFMAAPSMIEVEVEHDENMPHYLVRVEAYGILLRAAAERTQAEFLAWRQHIIDEQREGPTTL